MMPEQWERFGRAIERIDVLHDAREAHSLRTGHIRVEVGANFVECRECGRHADLSAEGPGLWICRPDGRWDKYIRPEEF